MLNLPFIRGLAVVLGLALTPCHAADLMLRTSDVQIIGNGPLIATGIEGEARDPSLPVVDPTDTSPEALQLTRLVARGISQGFDRILYDNRDRGHSTLVQSLFPNLTFLRYDAPFIDKKLDYGLAGPVLIRSIVFGNSSTAITAGKRQRSLVRFAMTRKGGAAQAFRDYTNNSIYIYPEHKDHDEVDLFPANWPYTIISQGSSFSDGPFLRAVAMTLAALPSDTRDMLEASGLVAPTIQMILRRNLTLVRTRANYVSPVAHPAVVSHKWLQTGRMIAHAASLRPEDIPPLVRLNILEEEFVQHAGLAGLDEHLFTTPSAIARVWRNLEWERQMVVTAKDTKDPNDHPLSFQWVLLRGDPKRVRIEPLDPDGLSARITMNWHDSFAVPPRNAADDIARTASRVDIGVFAWNGRSDSAPSIISVTFPTHQQRAYAAGPDGVTRLQSIDYDAVGRKAAFDPVLHWSAPWSDRFTYSPDGELLGWMRDQGELQLQFDAAGLRPDGTGAVYEMTEDADGLSILSTVPAN